MHSRQEAVSIYKSATNAGPGLRWACPGAVIRRPVAEKVATAKSMGTVSSRSWNDILVLLRTDHPELVRPWFKKLEPIEIQHGVVRVQTTDANQHQYLEQQCQNVFTQAAQSVTGRLVTVSFVPPPAPATTERQPYGFEIETDHPILNEEYTFEHFVTGPCNRLAHAACIAVAESPGRVYNPLFLHGNVGLGKTHLLQAACHRIRAEKADAKILFLSCETFTNHFIEAIERGALQEFRRRYRSVDALVIDDIQYLAAGDRTREEFFHTFNTLFQSQRQIILSADESPRDIPRLEDRLVSRFNWGLVARLDTPDLETRMAITRKKARLRCIDLPEDVAHYIASTAMANTREIEGAITKILALSQQFGGVIDMALARQALDNGTSESNTRNVTIQDILKIVIEHFGVRQADLQGKRRNRSIAYPRQICMYLARELTPLSLEEIGGHFGGRDHTTVLHAIRTIQEHQEQDAELQVTLQNFFKTLRKKPA